MRLAAAAVRVYWPTPRDNIVEAGASLKRSLEDVRQNAALLDRLAWDLEVQRDGTPISSCVLGSLQKPPDLGHPRAPSG